MIWPAYITAGYFCIALRGWQGRYYGVARTSLKTVPESEII